MLAGEAYRWELREKNLYPVLERVVVLYFAMPNSSVVNMYNDTALDHCCTHTL